MTNKNMIKEFKKLGVLRGQVVKAFDNLKGGDLRGFVEGISWVSDVRYAWHKSIVTNEIEKQLNDLCSEKKYCKNIILQHKKQMILVGLK